MCEILEAQKTKPLWTKPVAISPKDLKQLQDKYNNNSEAKPTDKEELKLLALPEHLLAQALKGIAFTDNSELYLLFFNFPTQWYGLLLTHLMHQKPIELLTKLIQQGFFSPEQQQSLVNAVLQELKRQHSAKDYVNAFTAAGSIGST